MFCAIAKVHASSIRSFATEEAMRRIAMHVLYACSGWSLLSSNKQIYSFVFTPVFAAHDTNLWGDQSETALWFSGICDGSVINRLRGSIFLTWQAIRSPLKNTSIIRKVLRKSTI